MSEKEVIDAAKSRGYSEKQINKVLKKENKKSNKIENNQSLDPQNIEKINLGVSNEVEYDNLNNKKQGHNNGNDKPSKSIKENTELNASDNSLTLLDIEEDLNSKFLMSPLKM